MFTFVLLAAVVTNDPSPRYDVVNLVPTPYVVVNRVPIESVPFATPYTTTTTNRYDGPFTSTACVGGSCGASAAVGLGYARGFAGFARPFRRR